MPEINPAAGKPVPDSQITNIPRLITAYFTGKPDPENPAERVSFGTSGHRGSALSNSFNETHILAITQAICDYRRTANIDGPLFIGMDTHALSEPALASALEVLAANEVTVMVDQDGGYTPTPAISRAILAYNKGRGGGLADGIVITPSHNPPEDGGFKYNPPNGGPADTNITGVVEKNANELIKARLAGVKRLSLAQARAAGHVRLFDYITPYIADLEAIVDLAAIRDAKISIGIDPLGGAAVHYWAPLIERYKLNARIVNESVDPTFRFMTADWDGKIRMDCSSPYAMERLIGMRDSFDVAFANDTDADRHGIVTKSAGLMNPNHFLATSIRYLFSHRPNWGAETAVGKTVVSSGIIDRVVKNLGRHLMEVPVGFKWFVDGLVDGTLGFVGEESAGASFLRRDGTVWTTDKDGLIMGLLAAEMTAKTGRDPGELFSQLTEEFGTPFYARIDAKADAREKSLLKNLKPEQLGLRELGGEKITATLSNAPGNDAPIGGIKVTAENGWFAARPSGTEDVYKIYAESFKSADHLKQIQEEAQTAIGKIFRP